MAQTPEQIRAAQKAQAERDTAASKVAVPAVTNGGGAVALPDNRTSMQRLLDTVAPASIVGRMAKFTKDGVFATTDDDKVIGDDVDFIVLADDTIAGFVKFNGPGNAPDRVMGSPSDGWELPARETLGDTDATKWEMGLDGRPQDPWQFHMYVVLQRGDTAELYTFVASSITARRAVGNLLKHYTRMQKTNPDEYPVIRLKVGGFNHRDPKIGWVKVPVFAVMGRAPKASAAKPDSSLAADLEDQIPF